MVSELERGESQLLEEDVLSKNPSFWLCGCAVKSEKGFESSYK